MGKLREYLQQEADRIRAETARQEATVREWRGALNRLFSRLAGWVEDSDPGGLLAVSRPDETFYEAGLGECGLPTLVVRLGDRAARIVPRARFVVAAVRPTDRDGDEQATGMAELRDYGAASHYLFRLPPRPGETDDAWYIQSVARWNQDDANRRVEPLTPDRFEAALLSVLQ